VTTDTPGTPHVLPLTFGEFARMAGSPRELFQERAFELVKRTTCVVAPRQSGKSETLALALLWLAYRRPGQKILIVSAGELASQRVLEVVRRIAASSPLLAGSIVDEQQSLVTISNGSRIKAVPASERQIRGETADVLAMDECALISDAVGVGAALPVVAAREHGKIIMVSSAGPASGFFFDTVKLGEGHSDYFATHYWDLDQCWWITASAKESFRQSATDQRWSSEFLNVFGGTSDNLLDRLTLDPCRVNYRQDRLDSMAGPAKVLSGHDWAMAGPDYSAMVAVGRFALRGRRVFGVRMTHRWPLGTPGHVVVKDIAGTPAHIDSMNSERNGMGDPLTEMLFRSWFERGRDAGGGNPERAKFVVVEELPHLMGPAAMPKRRQMSRLAEPTAKRPIFTNAANKAAMYAHLRLLFERGRLLIPSDAEDLYRELLQLKVDLTASGTEKIEARSGHDDLCDSLALSTTPYKDRSGAWRTLLSDLANPLVTPNLPEPILLPDAMDRVELLPGPGDLLVPRTPAWQSVRGSEVTLPPDLDWADPAVREMQRRVRSALAENQSEGVRR
jgi:hypothetical protein